MLIGTQPSAYIALIVIQQLTIVGLFWGILLLLLKLRRLQRGFRIRAVLDNAHLSFAGYGLASPHFRDLLSAPAREPARERAVEDEARNLISMRA
jgi:hypothetical protein